MDDLARFIVLRPPNLPDGDEVQVLAPASIDFGLGRRQARQQALDILLDRLRDRLLLIVGLSGRIRRVGGRRVGLVSFDRLRRRGLRTRGHGIFAEDLRLIDQVHGNAIQASVLFAHAAWHGRGGAENQDGMKGRGTTQSEPEKRSLLLVWARRTLNGP